jgi:hypothetical protein
MPCRMRATISELMVGTTAHMIDAMVNPAIPTRKIRLRP